MHPSTIALALACVLSQTLAVELNGIALTAPGYYAATVRDSLNATFLATYAPLYCHRNQTEKQLDLQLDADNFWNMNYKALVKHIDSVPPSADLGCPPFKGAKPLIRSEILHPILGGNITFYGYGFDLMGGLDSAPSTALYSDLCLVKFQRWNIANDDYKNMLICFRKGETVVP